jgi:hypothetical protein
MSMGRDCGHEGFRRAIPSTISSKGGSIIRTADDHGPVDIVDAKA